MWRCLFLTVLLLVVIGGPLRAETVVGPARVVDGDTLDIGATRIRLFGIDAPEGGQAYGSEATSTLVALTTGQFLSCAPSEMSMGG
jgi:endonuclease YncB( thermonuclease family)